MIAAKTIRQGKRPPGETRSGDEKFDSRIEAYLNEAPEFARPILGHLRALIRANCPGVDETIKWGQPMYVYKGRIFCRTAAFKAHCSLGFWHPDMKAVIARDGHLTAEESSGQFGRIKSVADLPDDATLRRYLAEAVRLHDAGKTARPRPAAGTRAEIPVPEDFALLLERHPVAGTAFQAFSPSHRREYLEWIVEAKREETRAKRMETAIEWLAQGKARNWKYEAGAARG